MEDTFGGEEADALEARGALGQRGAHPGRERRGRSRGAVSFATIARKADGTLRIEGDHAGESGRVLADRMIVATGFRPDLAILREIRLALDPWLESVAGIGTLIDPNLHSCGTVRPHGAIELAHPEQGFFIAGIKSYGRAPTFLLATGHEQVRSIAAMLAGDTDGARRVELELPETGVCSTRPSSPGKATVAVASSCCGGPAPAGVDACCADDAELKSDLTTVGTSCCTPTSVSACCAPTAAAE